MSIVNTNVVCASLSMGCLLQPVIEHNLSFGDAIYYGLFQEYKFSSDHKRKHMTPKKQQFINTANELNKLDTHYFIIRKS